MHTADLASFPGFIPYLYSKQFESLRQSLRTRKNWLNQAQQVAQSGEEWLHAWQAWEKWDCRDLWWEGLSIHCTSAFSFCLSWLQFSSILQLLFLRKDVTGSRDGGQWCSTTFALWFWLRPLHFRLPISLLSVLPHVFDHILEQKLCYL